MLCSLCPSLSSVLLCPSKRSATHPFTSPPCISHPLHTASAHHSRVWGSVVTHAAPERAGRTHSHAETQSTRDSKRHRAAAQPAGSRRATLPRKQQAWTRERAAEQGRLTQIIVNADRLDVVCEALQSGVGLFSPTTLVQTVAPKLSALLLQLPPSSPHRRWGVEALARYLRAVTAYLPALGPAELLLVLRVMRSARTAKVLQMRDVTAFLHKQHAQQQEHRAVASMRVHSAKAAAVPADAAAADTATSPTTSATARSFAARESPALSKLFEGMDPALQSLNVESWFDEKDDAAAQLLRVLRARVLRLCAAAVPATNLTASNPTTNTASGAVLSPGPTSHAPSESTATPPPLRASTHSSLLPPPPPPSTSAPPLPASAAGGVLVPAPDPIQAELIVRVLREMLDLQVTWTPKQGKTIYAFLARALESSALGVGRAVSALSSMARMCSLPTPPALANKVYAHIQAIPVDWRQKTHTRHNPAVYSEDPLQSINLPALARLMAKDRLQRKATQYQPPEAMLQHHHQQQQQQRHDSHPGTLRGGQQQQHAQPQQHSLHSSPPREHKGRGPSTASSTRSIPPLPSASLSAGSRASHMPVLASILGADMMSMLLPWPGEEGEHARFPAVAASMGSLYPQGSDTLPDEARRLAGELSVHFAQSGACHDPGCYTSNELGSIAASWRAAGLHSNQPSREGLTAATAPYTARDIPVFGLALAQMLGVHTLHVARDTGAACHAGTGEALWSEGGWNWQAVIKESKAMSASLASWPTWEADLQGLPRLAPTTSSGAAEKDTEQLTSPSLWLRRYCSKAVHMLHTPGALSIPQLWAIVARLIQLQLRAPSLLLLPLLPIGPVNPQSSSTTSTSHYSHSGWLRPHVVHGHGVLPVALPPQQSSQGMSPQQQWQHPYLLDCPPELPEVLEQLALAVGCPKEVGWDRPKVWDNWLDGRPFSECGCLPDLPGVVVLLEHLASVAQDAATRLSLKPNVLPSRSQQLRGRSARTLVSSCFRGYLEFGHIAGSDVGAAWQLDPATCAVGWQACNRSFPGTMLMLELLLHCADTELASIGRACSVPGRKMLGVTPFQRATLASNRTAFLGRHSSSTTITTTTTTSSNRSPTHQPSPSGSEAHTAFACHQLQLVLRLAAAISALGIELSPKRIGALVVVLMRLLRPAESLPHFVRTVHLLPLLGVELKSSLLKGTLLGMAQRMLLHSEQHLLPYANVVLAGADRPDEQQEQQQQQWPQQEAHSNSSHTQSRMQEQQASQATEQPAHAQHQHHVPISLFPVLALLRSLLVLRTRAGRAVDVALSDALQHTFLTPKVVVANPSELLELMRLMPRLACFGTSGASRSLQWHLCMMASHVAMQHGVGMVQGEAQGGPSSRCAGSSSSDGSSSGSGYASSSSALNSHQALQALQCLLGLGIMPAPQTAARLLKAALLELLDATGIQDPTITPPQEALSTIPSTSKPLPVQLQHRLRSVISAARLIVYPLTNKAALESAQAATAAMDLWLTQQQPQAADAAWATLDDLETQGVPVVGGLVGVPGQEEWQPAGDAMSDEGREADSGAPIASGVSSDEGSSGGSAGKVQSLDDMLDSFIDSRLEDLKQLRGAQ